MARLGPGKTDLRPPSPPPQLVKGRLGSKGGTYLKLNLITRYLAFEGQTSHFDAYFLRMRSD